MTPELLTYSRTELVRRRLVSGDSTARESVGQLRRARLTEQLAVLREFGVVKNLASIDEAVDLAALSD
jgi:hypothetical protein